MFEVFAIFTLTGMDEETLIVGATILLLLLAFRSYVAAAREAGRWPVYTTSTHTVLETARRPRAVSGALPLSLQALHGQSDARIKAISNRSYSLLLGSPRAVLSLHERLEASDNRRLIKAPRTSSAILRMELVNAKSQPQLKVMDEAVEQVSGLAGDDSPGRCTTMSVYSKVKYEGVYPGVDMVYYYQQRRLEYDFVIAPGADPGVIELRFNGADRVEIDSRGDLVLHTAAGTVRQLKPLVYQDIDGIRQKVSGSYVLRGDRQIGFELGDYDADRLLIIH